MEPFKTPGLWPLVASTAYTLSTWGIDARPLISAPKQRRLCPSGPLQAAFRAGTTSNRPTAEKVRRIRGPRCVLRKTDMHPAKEPCQHRARSSISLSPLNKLCLPEWATQLHIKCWSLYLGSYEEYRGLVCTNAAPAAGQSRPGTGNFQSLTSSSASIPAKDSFCLAVYQYWYTR